MYEKILAAIDESEVADRVLAAARELAALSRGDVLVVHMREREPSRFGVTSTESKEDAQAFVETAVGKLTATGISARGSARATLFGHTAREIIDDAESNDIDPTSVVVGSVKPAEYLAVPL